MLHTSTQTEGDSKQHPTVMWETYLKLCIPIDKSDQKKVKKGKILNANNSHTGECTNNNGVAQLPYTSNTKRGSEGDTKRGAFAHILIRKKNCKCKFFKQIHWNNSRKERFNSP